MWSTSVSLCSLCTVWLFPLLSPVSLRFKSLLQLSAVCLLLSFSVCCSRPGPHFYLADAGASPLSSGVSSEPAQPALAGLMACHDIGHPVTLSLAHIPQLLDTVAHSYTDSAVSYLRLQTTGNISCLREASDVSALTMAVL